MAIISPSVDHFIEVIGELVGLKKENSSSLVSKLQTWTSPSRVETAKLFPLDAVLGSIVFFYNLGAELSKVILNSSNKQNEETLAQYLISQPNGDGTIQSMESLKGILQNLNISLN